MYFLICSLMSCIGVLRGSVPNNDRATSARLPRRQSPAGPNEMAGISIGITLEINPDVQARHSQKSPTGSDFGSSHARPQPDASTSAMVSRATFSCSGRGVEDRRAVAQPISLPWRLSVVGSWIWKKNSSSSLKLVSLGSEHDLDRPRRACRDCDMVALGTCRRNIRPASDMTPRSLRIKILHAPETTSGQNGPFRVRRQFAGLLDGLVHPMDWVHPHAADA